MSWLAVAIGGGAIIGGASAIYSTNKAVDAQKEAGEKGLTATEQGYQRGAQALQPYYQQGQQDYQNFGNMVRGGQFDYQAPEYQDPNFNFEADPGYQFRQQEGNKALLGAASAQGNMLSGATMKAMQKYNQGLASQEYGNAYNRFVGNRDYLRQKYTSDRSFGAGQMSDKYNRYQGLANVGYSAAQQMGNMAIGQGSDMSNIYGQQGNAAAAGYMAQGQNMNDFLSNLLKAYSTSKMINGSLPENTGNMIPGQAGAMTVGGYR